MSDLEIVKKCQLGELYMFEKIYNKYIDEIYKFVYLKTTNRETAEDIVSDTFMSAFEKIDSFDAKRTTNFRAWIYKIAYNKVINFYKLQDRTTEICEYLDLALEEDIAQEVDNKEQLKDIQKYLETIKKRDRDVVIYRIWNDLSYKEIAEILDISVDNCKKIVSRTLKKITANFLFLAVCLLFV